MLLNIWYRVVNVIGYLLPRRIKRMVLIISLYSLYKGQDNIDDQTLHKLNQLLRLSHSDEALQLPRYLSNVIWKGRTTEDILSKEIVEGKLDNNNLQQAIASIYEKAPPSLIKGCRITKHEIKTILGV